MANISLPPPIIFPLPTTKGEEELFRTLQEYLEGVRQTLTEIVDELP